VKVIFLSYINRSGSTYLANQLSKSSDICSCPECDILYELFLSKPLKYISGSTNSLNFLRDRLLGDSKFKQWNISYKEIEQLIVPEKRNIDVFLGFLFLYQNNVNSNAKLIIFKYSWSINLINRMTQVLIKQYNLYWIALVRDIRAIYYSQVNTISPATNKSMCNNWYKLAREYNLFSRLVNINEENLIISIKYEDLIRRTSKHLMYLSKHLKFSFEKEWIFSKGGYVNKQLLNSYKTIHPHIDSFPDPEHIDKWKAIESQIDISLLSKFSNNSMKKNGYHDLRDEQPWSINLLTKISFDFYNYWIEYYKKTIKKIFIK
jgi:hypothetical protein